MHSEPSSKLLFSSYFCYNRECSNRASSSVARTAVLYTACRRFESSLAHSIMKKVALYIIFAVVILSSLGVIFRTQIQAVLFPIKEIHIHAGFQIYEDGKQKSFEDFAYMNDKPCGDHAPGEHVDEQLEKAHLHELVGDVVHVHREGATWGDLFTNLKYPVEAEKIEAYVNGEKLPMVLARKIQPYDRLVVFIGDRDENLNKYLDKQVTKDHIVKTEKRSEQCGKA